MSVTVTVAATATGNGGDRRTGPAVGNWLVAPPVYTFDLGGFGVVGQSPSAFAESDALSTAQQESVGESLRGRIPSLELSPADVAFVFDVAEGGRNFGPGYTVAVGDIDAETARSGLSDSGFERVGERRGFSLHRQETESLDRVAAAGDGALVTVTDPGSDPLTLTEHVVDTRTGANPRYTDTSPGFDSILDAVVPGDGFSLLFAPGGPASETVVERGQFRGQIGRGVSYTLGDPDAEFVSARLFRDAGDITISEVETWAETAALPFDGTEVETDGRLAVVRGEGQTGELADWLSGGSEDDTGDSARPQVGFDYDYNGSSSELQITHASGDPFTAGQVGFAGTGIGEFAGAPWHDLSTDEAVTASSDVGPGGRAVGQVESRSFEIDIVWSSEDGAQSVVLSSQSGPDG
ncbi:MAG: hypothetical protein J07HX64_01148 [halophilic archaeon J07HX64]|nr:MAG: hypothetical protein J07HX64_01148 [halophilic archaeon J07HX64]